MMPEIYPLPIEDEEFKWWVDYAKTMPSFSEAQFFENALRFRLIDENPKRRELLDSIRYHFFEENSSKAFKKIEDNITSKMEERYGLPNISLNDEQIADAVLEIQSEFKSGKDYQSIYRILVDYCGWLQIITDFCKRFVALDFKETLRYPVEYEEKNPSKSTFYQNIQEGVKLWPNHHSKWKVLNDNSGIFIQRKNIANKFYDILKRKEKEF